MKSIDEVMNILQGSKRYEFGYNEAGMMSVLTITDYYSGESVSLDLSRMDEAMLDALQYEPEEGDDFDY